MRTNRRDEFRDRPSRLPHAADPAHVDPALRRVALHAARDCQDPGDVTGHRVLDHPNLGSEAAAAGRPPARFFGEAAEFEFVRVQRVFDASVYALLPPGVMTPRRLPFFCRPARQNWKVLYDVVIMEG